MELLSTLRLSLDYGDIFLLETSAILRPDKVALQEHSFLQFMFDNADFNVNMLDGLSTFHIMGGIMISNSL